MEKKISDYEENIKNALQGLKRRETDIVRLAGESVLLLARPESVRVSVTSDISDPFVWIDAGQILKILVSLETNAVEAMPQGGSLSIRVAGDSDQVTVTIEDTGFGISRENMDKLFTPFFTTKPVGEGTGLGLPRAYATVKLHEGKIEVRSNDDPKSGLKGTRIRIILPRWKPDLTKVILHEE